METVVPPLNICRGELLFELIAKMDDVVFDGIFEGLRSIDLNVVRDRFDDLAL